MRRSTVPSVCAAARLLQLRAGCISAASVSRAPEATSDWTPFVGSAAPQNFGSLCTQLTEQHSSLQQQPWLLSLSRGAKKKPRFAEAEGDGAVQDDVDLEATQKSMAASYERLQSVLATVRTGRASAGLIENLTVDVYGDKVPLRSLGAISVRDAQTLLVSPWDKGSVAGITKAIGDSPLQLSPRQEGAEVIVPVPKPSKEFVAGMSKMVKGEAENSRISIRQARKQAVDRAKSIVSKNDKSRAERKVQELTDDFIEKVNKITDAKEAELAAIV